MRLAPALAGSVLLLTASSVVLAAAAGDAATPASATSAPTIAPDQATQYKALVTRYCVACHNANMQSGGIALHDLDFNPTGDGAAKLERVV
ncbi:MAG: hypothetical protein ABIO39_10850, partial [Caulobacteraceae bacterium]